MGKSSAARRAAQRRRCAAAARAPAVIGCVGGPGGPLVGYKHAILTITRHSSSEIGELEYSEELADVDWDRYAVAVSCEQLNELVDKNSGLGLRLEFLSEWELVGDQWYAAAAYIPQVIARGVEVCKGAFDAFGDSVKHSIVVVELTTRPREGKKPWPITVDIRTANE